MRLSPVYPTWYLGRLGDAYRLAGRHEEAIAAFEKVICREPDDVFNGRVRLVVSLIDVERDEESRALATEILRINPKFTVARYMKSRLYKDPSVRKQMREALVKAGLPE